ncbi:hypothetical protein jhhlp_004558 [Lomentospora prolificans]|uniref:N-alpha-acetyltransferase 40 n=1 Tax=Lomentospora prolificans TaxID=41688 RepID=A0A2N3NBW7_9PEZI|nr:hypothetical protein jhhlp_004558 [Lomentospora prolificans]
MVRRRAPNPIEVANNKDDEEFVAEYLRSNPAWSERWFHPQTGAQYAVRFCRSRELSGDELQACLSLVEETSGDHYKASSRGWHAGSKRREMRESDMRYILVADDSGSVRGFTSLMLCYEEGEPVVYCYEIHLKPELQGSGLGKTLMSFLETIGMNVPTVKKVMLTCFLANADGLEFYKKIGFEKDEISPEPRKLRFGKVFTPDYMILSKGVGLSAKSNVLS